MSGSPIVYEPWSIVENIDVPVRGVKGVSHVRVPYAYAVDAAAVMRTATVVAMLCVRAIQVAGRMEQVDKAASRRFEGGPLIQMRCEAGDHHWDAWLEDDGTLQDKRDILCTEQGCPGYGRVASQQREG